MREGSTSLALLGGTPRFETGFFPLDRAELALGAREAVVETLESGRWSMFTSPHVEAFEAEFAQYVGAKHAVMVNSCTTALMASLAALGIGAGNSIVAPSFTYIGSVQPARVLDAEIHWVDIAKSHQCIDVESLRSSVRSTDIDAVIFPALFGACNGYEEIADICRTKGIHLVFDCAQFLGDRLATSRMAEYGLCCFSFGESKILRIGEGGAVATNSDTLAERIRLFRHEGEMWLSSKMSRVAISDVSPRDVLSSLTTMQRGLNLRPLAIAAALGRAQLRGLGEFLGATDRNARVMNDQLSALTEIRLPTERAGWWTFPVTIEDPDIDRDTLLAALLAEGLPVGVHFPNLLPYHPLFSDGKCRGDVRYPNAERFAGRHLVLPVYPRMDEESIRNMAQCLSEVVSSPGLRTEKTTEVASAYLRDVKLQELSAGLYLFPEGRRNQF